MDLKISFRSVPGYIVWVGQCFTQFTRGPVPTRVGQVGQVVDGDHTAKPVHKKKKS